MRCESYCAVCPNGGCVGWDTACEHMRGCSEKKTCILQPKSVSIICYGYSCNGSDSPVSALSHSPAAAASSLKLSVVWESPAALPPPPPLAASLGSGRSRTCSHAPAPYFSGSAIVSLFAAWQPGDSCCSGQKQSLALASTRSSVGPTAARHALACQRVCSN